MGKHHRPDGRLWNYLKWWIGLGQDPYSYRPRSTYEPKAARR